MPPRSTNAPNSRIEVTVPLDSFEATSFGRVVKGAGAVKPHEVNAVGFLLGDKKPGPFKLEVAWIKRVTAGARPSTGPPRAVFTVNSTTGDGAALSVTLSMVADGPAVDALYRGPDGLLRGARPEVVLVDLSTVPPSTVSPTVPVSVA